MRKKLSISIMIVSVLLIYTAWANAGGLTLSESDIRNYRNPGTVCAVNHMGNACDWDAQETKPDVKYSLAYDTTFPGVKVIGDKLENGVVSKVEAIIKFDKENFTYRPVLDWELAAYVRENLFFVTFIETDKTLHGVVRWRPWKPKKQEESKTVKRLAITLDPFGTIWQEKK